MTNNGVKEAKFMYNGIKVDRTLYKGWYSMSGNGGRMEGSIVIYARDYKSFPKIEGLTIKNDSHKKQLVKAMNGHIIQYGIINGYFKWN